ncbi:allophanate hydrolase [Pseudomonas sp. LB-090624]|uniref:5-oxoprolinase subunit C family protein n=1 Tax=Pseudomonas sp. LB-090624 TaxID=2213079 RepID=UPI000D9B92BC|nr:biotin-dependent carboxyltransferase family protein [Pseudomonas sp. LB-090624]PYB78853.1 allophanate hydrolase [Pseudomonas sp. LB-090624]
MIEILSNGALNFVVDRGRFGFLDCGVSRSGPMDGLSFALGNAMVGNLSTAAGVEINSFPFKVRFSGPTTVVLTGAVSSNKLGTKELASWTAVRVEANEVLTVGAPRVGRCVYLAIRGGIKVPEVLGSFSTDLKAEFGGYHSRALQKTDWVDIHSDENLRPVRNGYFRHELADYWKRLSAGEASARVLPSAEWDDFNTKSRDRFFGSLFQVERSSNRQGYRLAGPEIVRSRANELLSHGIVPGTVQIPSNGQPIIQLVDANTCGGYPKLANVIDADLWRLGQLMPGDRVRFELVGVDEALSARSEVAGLIASAMG